MFEFDSDADDEVADSVIIAMLYQLHNLTIEPQQILPSDVSIKRKQTFSRKCNSTSFVPSQLGCTICKKIFPSLVEFRIHLHSHFKFPNVGFQLQKTWERTDLAIKVMCSEISCDLKLCNVGLLIAKIGHVYVVNINNATLVSCDEFSLEKGTNRSISVHTNLIDTYAPNTIIIQSFNGEYEFFDHIEVGVCCGNRNITDIEKPLKLESIEMCKTLSAIMAKSDSEIDSHFRSKGYPRKVECTSYKSIFSELSMIERVSNQLELDKYSQERVLAEKTSRNPECSEIFVKVKNAKDTFHRLSTHDMATLTPHIPAATVKGKITRILQDTIVIELERDKNKELPSVDKKMAYKLTFQLNTYTYDMESEALTLVCVVGKHTHLFPTIQQTQTQLPSARLYNWFNADIAANQMQMQAVHHIVQRTSHPAPYILFGPPGTGKTKTVVEAISQIHKLDKSSRILVCATSNAAADELAMRIIQNLPNDCWKSHRVYRICASSYAPEVPMDTQLRQSSNFVRKNVPELEYLKKFRIIVATLLVAGSLRYAELKEHYFTHLFIDECGSATEISTLVAIACARHAHIVLSGDPKQLGPVLFSKHASNFGLGISLLERLMENEVYQKNPESNCYNANVLTKLVNNYRSHPAIIAPSNRLFYDGDLIASGPPNKTHRFVGWKHLPSAKTPIIFHACYQQSQREHNSTSIFNMHEVYVVIKYVELIMKEQIDGKTVCQTDIGIISPYKKQCVKLKEELAKRSLEHIMVATVEKFQGKEKPVILVSTTRSKMHGIGFLRSPQRLNVLLTRAQSLMIIVGDPRTLNQDKNWRQVLVDLKAHGVFTSKKKTGLIPV